MYVCVYVCVCVCMYVCMYVRIFVCMYACIYVRTYECTYVCMCVYLCICMYKCGYIYTRMYVCTYVSTYVCMNTQTQTNTHTQTLTHTPRTFRIWNFILSLICCIGAISVAVGAHQFYILYATSFCSNVTPKLVSRSRRKRLSHVFNQGVTAYFTSTSVVNSLPFGWFLMGPKRWKTPGPRSVV